MSSSDRHAIARDLYVARGIGDAAVRCDVNTAHGSADLTAALIEVLALRPGDAVLDVGCGAGAMLARLAEAVAPGGRARGYDFAPEAVERTRDRGLDAAQASGDALPEPDGAWDALNAAYMVYYLPDPARTAREWRRVLRTGGRLAVSGPAADTNAELYAFHRAVTGASPSDADRAALGFVDEVFRPAAEAWFDVTVSRFENVVAFPDAEAALAYWRHSSLFLRTVPEADREAAVAEGSAWLDRFGPLRIRKTTTILAGRAR